MLIERRLGSANEFITTEFPNPFVDVSATVYEVQRPALVLGSAQNESSANLRRCATEGVDVVRRRSGGAAVFLDPGRSIWIDVLVPRTHAWWSDDIRATSDRVGRIWHDAFRAHGVDASIHEGGLQKNPWSRHVCFAALGPGEVVIDGRKLVGISQRRTKAGARVQSLVLAHWDPADVLTRLALAPAELAQAMTDLRDVAAGSPISLYALEQTVLDALASA